MGTEGRAAGVVEVLPAAAEEEVRRRAVSVLAGDLVLLVAVAHVGGESRGRRVRDARRRHEPGPQTRGPGRLDEVEDRPAVLVHADRAVPRLARARERRRGGRRLRDEVVEGARLREADRPEAVEGVGHVELLRGDSAERDLGRPHAVADEEDDARSLRVVRPGGGDDEREECDENDQQRQPDGAHGSTSRQECTD